MRRPLLTARDDHGTLQRPLVQARMPVPHQHARAPSSLPTEKETIGQTMLIESDNMAMVSSREELSSRPSTTRLLLCTSGRSPDCSGSRRFIEQASTRWRTTCHEITRTPQNGVAVHRLHKSVPVVGHAPGGPLCLTPEPPPPLLVSWTDHPWVAASSGLSQSWTGLQGSHRTGKSWRIKENAK